MANGPNFFVTPLMATVIDDRPAVQIETGDGALYCLTLRGAQIEFGDDTRLSDVIRTLISENLIDVDGRGLVFTSIRPVIDLFCGVGLQSNLRNLHNTTSVN